MPNLKKKVTIIPRFKATPHWYKGAAFIAVFAVAGTVLLFISHAATPVSSIQAESGTVSSAASVATDSTAADNQAIKFGTSSGAFQANCIVSPHLCGYPDATNTGVPAGTTLTNVPSGATSGTGWTWNASDGAVRITTAGAVVSNLNITGSIEVMANNVTVKNTRITSGDYYPVNYDDGTYSGLVVQDSEIAGQGLQVTAAMSFGNYTALRLNVHNVVDGFKGNSNVTIQDSYIHDLAVTGGANPSHNDGIQSTGGSNVTFQHNTCDLRNGGDDCFQPGPSDTNWLYTNNLLAGGSTTCWILNGNTGTKNSVFTDNRFTRTFGCGAASLPGSGITWSGNYFDDNDAVVND